MLKNHTLGETVSRAVKRGDDSAVLTQINKLTEDDVLYALKSGQLKPETMETVFRRTRGSSNTVAAALNSNYSDTDTMGMLRVVEIQDDAARPTLSQIVAKPISSSFVDMGFV